MAIVAPILDNRTFQQLKDDLVRRIPTFTPEWTDHNESDPGIALLELFASLGESLLFRFNQIPDRTKIAFLRLLQMEPRPAQPARALVAATTEDPAGVQILQGNEMKAGSVAFETNYELYVWPLDVAGFGKMPLPDPDPVTDADLFLDREDIARRLNVPAETIALYSTVALPADLSDPSSPTINGSETADQSLWIAVLRKETTDISLLAGRSLFIGVEMDGTIPGDPFTLEQLGPQGAEQFRCPGTASSAPATLWELWKPGDDVGDPPSLEALEVSHDTTRGLTRSGVVAITLPADFRGLELETPPSGGIDSPPPIEDPEQIDRVLAWLRVRRPKQENDLIGRVRWIGSNAVEATQSSTAPLEFVGTGNGDAAQRFRLANANILPGTIELEVEELGGWRRWDEVDTFVGSTQDDRWFVVHHAAGEVEFGGIGHHPGLGERIRTRTYRHGGGLAGNVGAKSISRATRFGSVKLSNPLPARGGEDAEQLDQALERVPDRLYRRDRVVTEDDFRDAALELTAVARADTLGRFHPDSPRDVAAGVVTVVIFPNDDRRSPATPMPDQPLLSDVCRHLDARRLITTELYVIPPTYRQIALAAGVKVRDGYQVDAIRRWVELILRQFLAPLPPGGPDGAGWPLGRDVRRQELEAVAVQVDGVEYLEGLNLAELTAAGTWQGVDEVVLERWEVPTVASITVVAGTPLAAGDLYEAETPADQRPLAPVPKDVC